MVVVLELASLFPGPLVGHLLQQRGCRVVKVEPPDGDPARRMPPLIDGTGFAFWAVNRGKESVVLDLKQAADVEALRSIARRCEVIVEAFRPGVLERWLDPAQLAREGKIVLRLSGYGQSSPHKAERGHDITYAAHAGALWLQEGGIAVPIADVAGALWGVAEVWRCLAQRRGEVLDVSLAGSARLMPLLIQGFGRAGGDLPEGNPLFGGVPWYGVFECRDGKIAIGALEPHLWQAAADALDVPVESERAAIAAALAGADVEPVVQRLVSAGVGAARLLPPRFDAAYGSHDPAVIAAGSPPQLGEHTRAWRMSSQQG